MPEELYLAASSPKPFVALQCTRKGLAAHLYKNEVLDMQC